MVNPPFTMKEWQKAAQGQARDMWLAVIRKYTTFLEESLTWKTAN